MYKIKWKKLRGVLMGFSAETIFKAFIRASGCCEYCGAKLDWNNHREGQRGAWEAHHKIAQKDGGSDNLSNCKILCLNCHKNTDSYGSH